MTTQNQTPGVEPRRFTLSDWILTIPSRSHATDGRGTAEHDPAPYVSMEMLPNYLRRDIGLAPR